MTDNLTSKAVADIFANALNPRVALAIQQKFQRMEEALLQIAKGTTFQVGSADVTYSTASDVAGDIAKDAIAFDPLSPL